MNERTCRRCGRETWSPHSPYCRTHRPSFEKRQLWAKKSRMARGYGEAHKAMRARYARLVEAGQAAALAVGARSSPERPRISATLTATGADTRALSIDGATATRERKAGRDDHGTSLVAPPLSPLSCASGHETGTPQSHRRPASSS